MNLRSLSFGTCALITLVLAATSTPPARADGFDIGAASNFGVLYEGNGGNTLNLNNSGITGNIGIGATGKFDSAGGCVGNCLITGAVDFSAANTGQFTSNSTTITGGVNYNVSAVTSALNAVNSLSQSLGLESGTAVNIASGGSINASSGALDANGNRVFTATINSNFSAGTTFTINGTASQHVVLNIPTTGGHGFNGSIVLAGGITSDQVLFNFDAGNYSTLSGGDTLTISTSGNATTGIFLDPNGNIQINHSILDGRLFGGDTQNMQIVSGATIVAPVGVPGPFAGAGLPGLVAACLGLLTLRRRPTRRRPR